jgi:plastocyanin
MTDAFRSLQSFSPTPLLLRLVPLLALGTGMLIDPTVAQSDGEPAAVVGMTNTMTYTPDTVRVAVGQTVRWENSSAVMHTVMADPEEAFKDKSVELPDGASTFNSGNLDPKATFEHTFEVAGTYRYFCVPHEAVGMTGTVIVESASEK